MDAVQDYALRAGEQSCFDRYDTVSGHPSVIDEPLVALADPGRRGAVDGVSRDREVAQATLRVQGAGEELVHAGDGGEALSIRGVVRGAESDQSLHPPVSRVAPASVRGIPADVHPARKTARRVSYKHRLFRLALEQRPVHRARDLEDQLPEAPEVSKGPVKGRQGGDVHLGAGDLS